MVEEEVGKMMVGGRGGQDDGEVEEEVGKMMVSWVGC